MKATVLKSKILDLREGQYFELEDRRTKQYLTVEGGDDGWLVSLPESSLMIRFNELHVIGNDIYLSKEEKEEEGKEHIIAVLDAVAWDVVGEES